jgi:hypothetical protein
MASTPTLISRIEQDHACLETKPPKHRCVIHYQDGSRESTTLSHNAMVTDKYWPFLDETTRDHFRPMKNTINPNHCSLFCAWVNNTSPSDGKIGTTGGETTHDDEEGDENDANHRADINEEENPIDHDGNPKNIDILVPIQLTEKKKQN